MEKLLRYPAEWERHDAVWLAWPAHQDPWGDTPLADVQAEFVGLCEAIDEPLRMLVPDTTNAQQAARALNKTSVTFFRLPFGDIWLRDTAPLFLRQGKTRRAAVFRFNGWGGKFVYPDDDTVAGRIAEASGDPVERQDWVLEGGSVDTNGEGSVLTTEECLLHPNRNPGHDRTVIEAKLGQDLGARKVLWLKQGLRGDHTDGHIDNIARFIGPRKVICMEPCGADDPNREVLEAIREQLKGMTDAAGRPLEVVTVPSPGPVLNRHGGLMAASHVNFYISNRAVVVPLYPTSRDTEVLAAVQAHFPDRPVVGRPAWNILHGGGSFHCITQQVPSLP